MQYLFGVSLLVVVLSLGACGGGGGAGGSGGGVTATEEEVGKLIFEDTRLSANNNQSCASCHSGATTDGFADPDVTSANPVSEGSVQ